MSPAPLRSAHGVLVRSMMGAVELSAAPPPAPPPLWSPYRIFSQPINFGEPVGWRFVLDVYCRNIGQPSEYFTDATLRLNDDADYTCPTGAQPISLVGQGRCFPSRNVALRNESGLYEAGFAQFRSAIKYDDFPGAAPQPVTTAITLAGGESATDLWEACNAQDSFNRAAIIDRPVGLWEFKVEVDWIDNGPGDVDVTVRVTPLVKSQWDLQFIDELPSSISLPTHPWHSLMGAFSTPAWSLDGDIVRDLCAGARADAELLPDASSEHAPIVSAWTQSAVPDLAPWRADLAVDFDDLLLAGSYPVTWCNEVTRTDGATFYYYG